jgi:hypothetical protein
MLMEMQRHQVNGTALEKSIGQRRDRTADAPSARLTLLFPRL